MKLLKRVVTVSLLVSALSMSGITGVSAVTSVYGDVNNDGVVNSADMVCMNNFLGGNLEVSATQLAKFDLNNNKIVTKVDALALYNLLLS
ncbi:MAG: dockerin type I repeat-containing protein [Oscillospiraceae bacterium]|nr:dockerin type I repeat-containing protein [Oscillospiraceae bacterium]